MARRTIVAVRLSLAVILLVVAGCRGSGGDVPSDSTADPADGGPQDAGRDPADGGDGGDAADGGDGGDAADGGPVIASAASELIADDEWQGKIDAKTAAYYQMLAQFSPSRLPDRYHVDEALGSLPSVAPMMVARARLAEYGVAEQAAVKAMLTE